MREHELWRHRESGDVYAVRFVDGVIAGVAGPLPFDDRREEFLPTLDYGEEGAEWVEREREGFDVYVPDHGSLLR
jgi:hypothetical protein